MTPEKLQRQIDRKLARLKKIVDRLSKRTHRRIPKARKASTPRAGTADTTLGRLRALLKLVERRNRRRRTASPAKLKAKAKTARRR